MRTKLWGRGREGNEDFPGKTEAESWRMSKLAGMGAGADRMEER